MEDRVTNTFGFTLVEILLITALVSGISAIGMPIALSMQHSNNIQVASDALRSSLRDAQSLARASQNNDNWGVHIATGEIVIFQGSSYATRTLSSDKVHAIANNIQVVATPNEMSDVIFFNTSGSPSVTGSISLELAGLTRNINLNEKGAIL